MSRPVLTIPNPCSLLHDNADRQDGAQKWRVKKQKPRLSKPPRNNERTAPASLPYLPICLPACLPACHHRLPDSVARTRSLAAPRASTAQNDVLFCLRVCRGRLNSSLACRYHDDAPDWSNRVASRGATALAVWRASPLARSAMCVPRARGRKAVAFPIRLGS